MAEVAAAVGGDVEAVTVRTLAVALGLPDCSGGYVYREVAWEPV